MEGKQSGEEVRQQGRDNYTDSRQVWRENQPGEVRKKSGGDTDHWKKRADDTTKT